jgi:hypothetical protein
VGGRSQPPPSAASRRADAVAARKQDAEKGQDRAASDPETDDDDDDDVFYSMRVLPVAGEGGGEGDELAKLKEELAAVKAELKRSERKRERSAKAEHDVEFATRKRLEEEYERSLKEACDEAAYWKAAAHEMKQASAILVAKSKAHETKFRREKLRNSLGQISQWVCVNRSLARSAPALDSEIVGMLNVGDRVVVTETRTLPACGTVRVRAKCSLVEKGQVHVCVGGLLPTVWSHLALGGAQTHSSRSVHPPVFVILALNFRLPPS